MATDDTERAPTHLPRARRDRVLAGLVADQAGMVARRQLTAAGIDWDAVEANIVARRWVARTPRVISTVTGELTVEQRRWLGVLHAGPRSILGGLTAAARHGLVGWERETVTVLVDDELSFGPVDGIRFFRSRRPFGVLAGTRPASPRPLSSRRSSCGRRTTRRHERLSASWPPRCSSA